MLIQFSVKNYKVFREMATLSMIASEYEEYKLESEATTYFVDKMGINLLVSAVIYGANASGKSKFLEALVSMKSFAISSSKEGQKGDSIPVEPFLLHAADRELPSEFEVIFYHNSYQYRYGFEVDQKRVHAEWLYRKSDKAEEEIFYRENQEFTTHKTKFTRGFLIAKEDIVRDNALMLSVAAQFNDPICRDVLDWFQNIEVITNIASLDFRSNAIKKIKSSSGKKLFIEYLQKADLGIRDLELMEIKSTGKVDYSNVLTVRDAFDKDGNISPQFFSLQDDESEGTRKFFYLLGPIIDVIERGGILLVDELDAKLHPNLVEKLILHFHSHDNNPNKAQLIFNTHNTNLMQKDIFRRDQIWFAEKNQKGEGKIYSLAEFMLNQKNDVDYESCYILGKYGAVPCLSDFDLEQTEK